MAHYLDEDGLARYHAAVKALIPTKTSDLTNDSGFITGYTETDPTVPSWAKAASKPSYTASEVGAQPTLVSGTNIKTVNGTTLLGSGDLTISANPTAMTEQEIETAVDDGWDVAYTITENGYVYSVTTDGSYGDGVNTKVTSACAGDTVLFTIDNSFYSVMTSLTVTDGNNNEVQYDDYLLPFYSTQDGLTSIINLYGFTMPSSNVAITVNF